VSAESGTFSGTDDTWWPNRLRDVFLVSKCVFGSVTHRGG
jgi:hypothetical protein